MCLSRLKHLSPLFLFAVFCGVASGALSIQAPESDANIGIGDGFNVAGNGGIIGVPPAPPQLVLIKCYKNNQAWIDNVVSCQYGTYPVTGGTWETSTMTYNDGTDDDGQIRATQVGNAAALLSVNWVP